MGRIVLREVRIDLWRAEIVDRDDANLVSE